MAFKLFSQKSYIIAVWDGSKYDSGHKHSNKSIRMRSTPTDTHTLKRKIVTKYNLNGKQEQDGRKSIKYAYPYKPWQ